MADIFDFYVYDDRSIQFELAEPIMLEDKDVTQFRFRIPKSLNGFDMSGWAWWFVYVNANGDKYSVPLTLTDDEDDAENFSVATFMIDLGVTSTVGSIRFAIEVIDADASGEILHEWHTRTYTTSVTNTLQGNQAEYAETESDIISALIVQVQELIAHGGGGVTVDNSLSMTSEHPVQNKVITAALQDKADASSLSAVATSGSYDDLSNKPSIPSISGLQTQAITDAGGYFNTDTVEAALQQLGASVDGVETLLAAI